MHQSNAILAINSLDRYITSATTLTTNMSCTWNSGSLDVLVNVAVFGVIPIVGATVVSAGPGWPVGVITIVAINNLGPFGYIFTMSSPTTAASGPGTQIVTQSKSLALPGFAPIGNALIAQYNQLQPYSNNFTIQSPGALIYGYITKLIVSQIQIQYNIPTISLNRNDTFIIATPGPAYNVITIPYGFYTPSELASVAQSLMAANPIVGPLNITVAFSVKDGFTFTSVSTTVFYFPDPSAVPNISEIVSNVYRTYRVFGMTAANGVPSVIQNSFEYPNFLYTPYIDIYSDILTNYQDIKDTNTTTSKFKGMIARVYLSGTGNLQTTHTDKALGTEPFVMTVDLNTPKVIQWTPDIAVPSIDIQLFDQYSQLIPGPAEGFSTEFQMTLLCVE
jgi:hypothetical protein